MQVQLNSEQSLFDKNNKLSQSAAKHLHERSVPPEAIDDGKSYFVKAKAYPVRGKGIGNLPKGKLYRSEG